MRFVLHSERLSPACRNPDLSSLFPNYIPKHFPHTLIFIRRPLVQQASVRGEHEGLVDLLVHPVIDVDEVSAVGLVGHEQRGRPRHDVRRLGVDARAVERLLGHHAGPRPARRHGVDPHGDALGIQDRVQAAHQSDRAVFGHGWV